jgi:hypothetical protein
VTKFLCGAGAVADLGLNGGGQECPPYTSRSGPHRAITSSRLPRPTSRKARDVGHPQIKVKVPTLTSKSTTLEWGTRLDFALTGDHVS